MNTLPPNKNIDSNIPVSGSLFDEMKNKLQKVNTTNILISMGYKSTKNGFRTLEKFLTSDDICDWLKSGHYDFHYNSKEFIENLCALIEFDHSLYKTEINHCTKIKNEYEKIRNCYIFVNTNFHRTTQPIFSLALMEGHRRLILAKQELMFKTNNQIFNNVSNLIKKHYRETSGEIPMWGKIDNYLYHHFDGKQYAFDSNGRLLDTTTGINESRATLSIK